MAWEALQKQWTDICKGKTCLSCNLFVAAKLPQQPRCKEVTESLENGTVQGSKHYGR